MSGVRHETVTPEEADQRLDRWFKRRFPGLSHGRLEKMLRKGAVRVDGGRAKAADRLTAGQVVRVPPLPDDAPEAGPPAQPRRDAPSAADAAFIQACVLHRDADVIALNKPAGLPVQGGTGQTRHVDGLLSALRFDRTDDPRLVHRLDKDTSGVLLLARSAPAAKALASAFQSRATRKTYWAVVIGAPTPRKGVIKTGLAKIGAPGAEKVAVVDWDATPATPGAKRAVSDYAVIESLAGRAAWVALRPVTGRTHQLRAHMSALECPIVGDGKYRGEIESAHLGGGFSKKLHLHARRIETPHPSGRGTLVIEAEPPEHMTRTFSALGWDWRRADPAPFADLDAALGR